VGNQIETVSAVEGPENVKVREALDIGEAGLKRAQDFQIAFRIVFGAKTARN
jgi:hypothetical protein